MADDKGIVKYQDRAGQELSLSPAIVRNYLVSGKRELVTDQEIYFFMGICKSRGLNPFAKDCYLIKYNHEPAQIITSVDFFRARARAQKDCSGWDVGIIVQTAEGTIKDSHGLILEGEKLLGAWFEAQPEGWKKPRRLEVNLRGYIKKTSEGKTTQFWSEEKQPTMIAKVAEAQGLRMLWPDEFKKLYTADEINDSRMDIIDIPSVADTEEPSPTFAALVTAKNLKSKTINLLDEFVSATAKAIGMNEDILKSEAAKNFDKFWESFRAWAKKQKNGDDAAQSSLSTDQSPPQANGQSQSETHATAPTETQEPQNGELASRRYAEIMDLLKKSPSEVPERLEESKNLLTSEQCREISLALDKAMAGA